MTDEKIHVAIIGGGLGGTVLMNALTRHDHLDVHVYESKDTFKERGASVRLAVNAQRALEGLGLGNVMDTTRTGAVAVNGARCIMGHGPDQGKPVIDKMVDLLTVHRPALLRELIDPLPQDRLHVNKKANGIEGREITFEDGTSAFADVVVGADGIHSSIRRFVLGEDNPAVDPVSAGIFDFRTVVPFDKALSAIGPEVLRPDQPLQTIYAGDGMVIFYDYINDGKDICIVGAGLTPDEWDDDGHSIGNGNSTKQWKKTVSLSWLLDRYRSWPSFVGEMVKLCVDPQTPGQIPLFIEWESGNASNLTRGPVCVMGDAAHATTPWQGAGLGQAIEDAMILDAVLGECRRVEDVEVGFRVYDGLMRPRGRRVVESSRRMAGLLMGKTGLNVGVLNGEMTPMWDFIYEWDTQAKVESVRERVREALHR